MICADVNFSPHPPLLKGSAHARCRAVVVVPARNEEDALPATLKALSVQTDLRGNPLDPLTFEVLLLLNNCTDKSAEVVRAWKARHAAVRLHVIEITFPKEDAHIGMARRLLMDTAWARLQGRREVCGILSSDADSVVAADWIAQNLAGLERGADAVGGKIELHAGDLERLPEGARSAYLLEQMHQRLSAKLEDRLDPQAGDPWPRHSEHFGASLACTPAIYERAGGLPPVPRLEDVAFIDRLRRIDARLRHDPAVRVFTSARLDGRVEIGLSWQMREWQQASETGQPQRAPSAEWLQHRFRSLHALRQIHRAGIDADLHVFKPHWRERIREALRKDLTTGEFLARIDCNAWIDETYTGTCCELEIHEAIRSIRAALALEPADTFNEASREASSPSGGSLPTHAEADRAGNAQPGVQ